MGRAPTVQDVAEAAGVSRQTVSNVLNSPGIVADATRERVESVIADLGYRPHASARRLRTRKSSTIGIRLDPVTDGISGSVLDAFLHALTEHADARGLRIQLFTARSPEHELEQIRRLRDGSDVDAFVLTSTFHGDPRTAWLEQHRVPFVTFGRPWGEADFDRPAHPWVDVDGRAGTRAATEHLRGLGARRIGYLGWPSPSGTGDERRAGWRAAQPMQDEEATRLSRATEDRVDLGAVAARELLAAGVDAVVCASDSLALGASIAIRDSGRDLPVIGYDDTPVAAAVGLSSVRQPLHAVAAAALELLFGARGGDLVDQEPDGARHRLLEPDLVVRGPGALARLEATTTPGSAGSPAQPPATTERTA